MNRLAKFKEKRVLRRKYISSFFLFFSILIAGVCVVDYSTNHLVRNDREIKILSFRNESAYVEISFMNRKLYLNTTYINRDFERLKKAIGDFTGDR